MRCLRHGKCLLSWFCESIQRGKFVISEGGGFEDRKALRCNPVHSPFAFLSTRAASRGLAPPKPLFSATLFDDAQGLYT